MVTTHDKRLRALSLRTLNNPQANSSLGFLYGKNSLSYVLRTVESSYSLPNYDLDALSDFFKNGMASTGMMPTTSCPHSAAGIFLVVEI